jgi:hypothetical protein
MKLREGVWLWTKMVAIIIAMLMFLAIIFGWLLEIEFGSFWSQVGLFMIAAFVGSIGVYMAFRTKTIFT